MALEQSQYVRVRDALSRDALGALTQQAEIEVLPDTAFGLPRLIDEQQPGAEFVRLREQAGLTGPYIVIHAIHVVESFVKLFEDHAEAFQGYQFLVVPIGPVLGDDPSVIAARLPQAITLSFWPEPLLMAEILSQAQAVIGHSYHLAITALAFGVPVFCSADLTTGKYTALAEFDSSMRCRTRRRSIHNGSSRAWARPGHRLRRVRRRIGWSSTGTGSRRSSARAKPRPSRCWALFYSIYPTCSKPRPRA